MVKATPKHSNWLYYILALALFALAGPVVLVLVIFGLAIPSVVQITPTLTIGDLLQAACSGLVALAVVYLAQKMN